MPNQEGTHAWRRCPLGQVQTDTDTRAVEKGVPLAAPKIHAGASNKAQKTLEPKTMVNKGMSVMAQQRSDKMPPEKAERDLKSMSQKRFHLSEEASSLIAYKLKGIGASEFANCPGLTAKERAAVFDLEPVVFTRHLGAYNYALLGIGAFAIFFQGTFFSVKSRRYQKTEQRAPQKSFS